MGNQASLGYRNLFQGNMRILIVSRILWSITGSIVFPYLSLYILALGGDPAIVGLVNAVGSIGGLILFPVGGYIADKKGRARFIGLATVLFAISYAFFALAQDWTMLAVALFLQQLSLFYSPALSAITADSIPKGMRGMGYALTVSVPSAVGIISPYIGGYLISMYTLVPANRIAYQFSFLLGLVVAAIRWKFLKETIEDTGENVPLRNIGLLFKTSFQELLKSFRWMSNKIMAYTIITGLISFAFSIAGPFTVMYATQIIGLTTYEWGTLLLIGGAVQTLSSIPIGSFIDKHSCRVSIVIGTIINCFSNLAFIFCKNYLQTLVIYMVLVIGHNLLFIGSSALLANTIPKSQRGRISAILGQGIITVSLRGGFSSGFLLFATSAIGSIFGGYIYELNPTYPWIIFPVVLGISAIISLKYIRDPEKVED